MLAADYATYREIMNQPSAWRSTLAVMAKARLAITAYRDCAWAAPIVLSGCGSPYYLAQSAAIAYRRVTGRTADAFPASNIWLFPDGHLTGSEKLLLCVTRSGETTEVIQAIGQFRQRCAGAVLVITCDEGSAVAKAADYTVALEAARERSLAQTQSFTSMLIASLMLTDFWRETAPTTAFDPLPSACSTLMESHQELAADIGCDLAGIERIFLLGSDALYGIACEGALKLMEMSLTPAEAFHFLEFRHGPKAMVNERSLVIGLVSEKALQHESLVLREMRAMGARALAISPATLDPAACDYSVSLPATVPDIARLPLYLPILQLIAFHRAIAKELNPDKPANLSAYVTLGNEVDQPM